MVLDDLDISDNISRQTIDRRVVAYLDYVES